MTLGEAWAKAGRSIWEKRTLFFNPLGNNNYQHDPINTEVESEEQATLRSSLLDNGKHAPALDIDSVEDIRLVESSTPGHYHLYIDKEVEWEDYKELLLLLAKMGIIEPGYAEASITKGFTALRVRPKKEDPKYRGDPEFPEYEIEATGYRHPVPAAAMAAGFHARNAAAARAGNRRVVEAGRGRRVGAAHWQVAREDQAMAQRGAEPDDVIMDEEEILREIERLNELRFEARVVQEPRQARARVVPVPPDNDVWQNVVRRFWFAPAVDADFREMQGMDGDDGNAF